MRAVVLAGPAAIAWSWYGWYEATMPAHMNIRADLAVLWPILLAVSLCSGLFLLTLLIEALIEAGKEIPKLPRLAFALWHSSDRSPSDLRSWQDPKQPKA